MTKAARKAELLKALRALHGNDDAEVAHSEADELLLKYIGDPEITEAWTDVPRWYA